jgi:HD-GYP domain-containing protein (c-di-GMP phosphodiesterase class II)
MAILNLREVVYALSEALDLVGIDDRRHGKRVAYMAWRCGQRLGMVGRELDDLILEGMLHDVGVSSTTEHARLAAELEWEGAQVHCEVGHQLLTGSALLERHGPVIRYHHTPWDDLVGLDLPPRVKRHANLLFLVDRVDSLITQRKLDSPLQARRIVHEVVTCRADQLFSAELVDAFLAVSRNEAFWFELEEDYLPDRLRSWARRGHVEDIEHETLAGLASLFANCVDAKSAYTAEHSQGVSRLSRALAEWIGMSPEQCERIEIAGLLHDLGKLRVPDEVLDKPGPLNDDERAVMDRHIFDTGKVLEQITGFEDIARWARQHHERLDGSGYPYRTSRQHLSMPARILAVADIFQALAQERPYRSSWPPEKIVDNLRVKAADGELDRYIVDLVSTRASECWDLAIGRAQGSIDAA